ncbi:MAG: hypothetical protein ABSB74_00020 [Tepidisphaeraceae bacterium]
MRFCVRWAACVGLLVAMASPSRADQVNNPHYDVWARFKAGSSRTWTGTVQAGSLHIRVQMTSTLSEVTADHVTIETRTTTDFGHGPHTGKPLRDTQDAKIEAQDVKDLGEQTVQAMGRSFNCRVYQMMDDTVDGKERPWGGKAMVWVCSEVPGGVVKIDANPQNTSASGQNALIVYELSAYEAK